MRSDQMGNRRGGSDIRQISRMELVTFLRLTHSRFVAPGCHYEPPLQVGAATVGLVVDAGGHSIDENVGARELVDPHGIRRSPVAWRETVPRFTMRKIGGTGAPPIMMATQI